MFASCSEPKDVKSFQAMNTFMTVQSFGKDSEKANQAVMEKILELENQISTTKESSLIYKLNSSNGQSVSFDNDTYALIKFGVLMGIMTDGALNIALYPVISAWGFTNENYRVPSDEEIASLLKKTDFTKIHFETETDFENEPSAQKIRLEDGMMIDLGAIGKGYAGDLAAEILKENGINCALMDFGGNIQAVGTKIDGSDWNIGIKNPWMNGGTEAGGSGTVGGAVAGVKIRDQAVITSGGYERFFADETGHKYIHIFDGKVGRPVESGIASVTIISTSGLYADALSTALFVMGTEKACEFWKTYKNFEMIILTDDEEIFYTDGLENKISFHYDFKNQHVIRK